jgi:hypothetical protein
MVATSFRRQSSLVVAQVSCLKGSKWAKDAKSLVGYICFDTTNVLGSETLACTKGR